MHDIALNESSSFKVQNIFAYSSCNQFTLGCNFICHSMDFETRLLQSFIVFLSIYYIPNIIGINSLPMKGTHFKKLSGHTATRFDSYSFKNL